MTAPPTLFPIALRLEDVPCLVVGGGPVAARKAASLLVCGAQVTVIAPETCDEIAKLSLRTLQRAYEHGDVAPYRLVIAATGSAEVDLAVFRDAEEAGVLVNAADEPEACRFYLPSVLRRGPVTVAVSTGGTSPALAAWLRRRLAQVVGPEFAVVAALLARARKVLREQGHSTAGADWSSLLDDELPAAVAAGRDDAARAARRAMAGRRARAGPRGTPARADGRGRASLASQSLSASRRDLFVGR